MTFYQFGFSNQVLHLVQLIEQPIRIPNLMNFYNEIDIPGFLSNFDDFELLSEMMFD